ncbi:bifunctional phosphopantothenoylcysteine decarboxylase/phosphopantothenate--cysteine ligase CoaBC [Fictibacillus sp. b24]|uniref:bifunctional phosphopantothenoylcysteine decarboxylase/phosphopantothenate--cysteine ligase CoaBC n=1 Tax=Fictibacillus sp. b24 TaxID=3055863 RepID=UPI0025A139DB|nr:bifunctional phosphopantothenoylcysteine decarboxylase/phosphopantothenate--cysteine ligase CoaBC [Fictibacillus sp. b24]MDM5316590.1 bifunctional phosphopantothenoylcysteine decarboxylase/phosphopantothenate--cysteine ligase CoaBC [Fictibacillus sp. b24]
MMEKKKILLAVSGGIAAYKAATVASRLYQSGYEVKVILTQSAQKFITPLTFQTLTRQEVYTDTFEEKEPAVVSHIDLADWADLVMIAPATANVIGKLANGIADDMLTTTLLATKADVLIAPAMNVNMFNHPAVMRNMETLSTFGWRFIEPNEGLLACGWIGKGRLAEPEELIQSVHTYFHEKKVEHTAPLKGKKVLVTAGPTREELDPVRYFTNHSSGKMGYAIAAVAKDLGADVTLVTGPTSLSIPDGIAVEKVTSAREMFDAVLSRFSEQDIVIKCAAVADYTPTIVHNNKFKKKNDTWTIELKKTDDILQALGERKEHQVLIGFAAETENLENYAKDKLTRKNLDMVVGNDVSKEGSGFGSDTNEIMMIKKDGSMKTLPILSKEKAAREIFEEVMELMNR